MEVFPYCKRQYVESYESETDILWTDQHCFSCGADFHVERLLADVGRELQRWDELEEREERRSMGLDD